MGGSTEKVRKILASSPGWDGAAENVPRAILPAPHPHLHPDKTRTHPFLALGLDLSLRGCGVCGRGGTKGRDWEKSADWGRGGCWGLAPGVVRVRAAAARLGFSETQIPRRRLGAGVVTAS